MHPVPFAPSTKARKEHTVKYKDGLAGCQQTHQRQEEPDALLSTSETWALNILFPTDMGERENLELAGIELSAIKQSAAPGGPERKGPVAPLLLFAITAQAPTQGIKERQ